MSSPKLFGGKSLPVRAVRILSFTLCLVIAPSLALANEVKKTAARPVARLLSTSRQETPARERVRMVASYRSSTTAAAPTRATTVVRVAPTGNESRLFDLINEERRSRGKKPLVWDGELTRMARYHSENMLRQGFFNHVDADGLDLSGRAELLGIHGWRALAENIAYNQGFDDPESFAVERWMTSTKHRENILNGEFTHAGLGVMRGSDGRVYFTQVFMKR